MIKVRFEPNARIIKCPQCGNNTEFTVFSSRICEDACNVWIECKCGFDPTADNTNYRLEDVWGSYCSTNICNAADCWNDAIVDLFLTDYPTKKTAEQEPSNESQV